MWVEDGWHQLCHYGSDPYRTGGHLNQLMCRKLDLRGSIVPFTLLKVCQAFKQLEPGELLEVCWSNSDNPDELFKILPMSSFRVVLLEELPEGHFERRVILKKTAARVSPHSAAPCRRQSTGNGNGHQSSPPLNERSKTQKRREP